MVFRLRWWNTRQKNCKTETDGAGTCEKRRVLLFFIIIVNREGAGVGSECWLVLLIVESERLVLSVLVNLASPATQSLAPWLAKERRIDWLEVNQRPTHSTCLGFDHCWGWLLVLLGWTRNVVRLFFRPRCLSFQWLVNFLSSWSFHIHETAVQLKYYYILTTTLKMTHFQCMDNE